MNKYTITLDFASKLGFSVWKNGSLVVADSFNFQDKEFKKTFKDKKFQDEVFDKIVFFNSKAKQLVEKIFAGFDWNKEDEFEIIFELSDFGFRYSIENITRLHTMTCLALENWKTQNEIKNFKVWKIIAVSWRSKFKKLQPDFEYSKYEVEGKNNKKKIEWKTLAKDFVQNYCLENNFEITDEQLRNNDITDAIIIGWIYTR